MSNDTISLEGIEALTEKFSQLNGKEQKKAKNTALKKAAQIIVKAAKQSLSTVTKHNRTPNYWNGKTLESGIKVGKIKDDSDLKVHIMGDFRLKFFQSGTQLRKNKKGAVRGAMKRTNFFGSAVNSSLPIAEKAIDTEFQAAVNKIWDKR